MTESSWEREKKKGRWERKERNDEELGQREREERKDGELGHTERERGMEDVGETEREECIWNWK